MSVSELALEEFLIDLFATQPVLCPPQNSFLLGQFPPVYWSFWSHPISKLPCFWWPILPCWFRLVPQLHLRLCPHPQIPWFHLILLKPGNPPKPFDSSAPHWFVVPLIPLVCQPSDSTGFLIPPALSIITLTLPWTYAVPWPYIPLAPLGSSFPLASFSSLLPAGSATVFLAPSSTSVFLPCNST